MVRLILGHSVAPISTGGLPGASNGLRTPNSSKGGRCAQVVGFHWGGGPLPNAGLGAVGGAGAEAMAGVGVGADGAGLESWGKGR